MREPVPYKERFPVGTAVRIQDQSFLTDFMKNWKYHHKLEPAQLSYANAVATVQEVTFYHGGDPIYKLRDIPGLWLEQCLEPI